MYMFIMATSYSSLLISDQSGSGLVSISPPVTWEVAWDRVRGVQLEGLAGVVLQGTEHGLIVRHGTLQ